jgi:hypothetical protein
LAYEPTPIVNISQRKALELLELPPERKDKEDVQ